MFHTIIAYILIFSFICVFLRRVTIVSKQDCFSSLTHTSVVKFQLSPNVSNAVKGILAIVIICHHWCLYTFDTVEFAINDEGIKHVLDPLPRFGGHFSLILFLFLSGYGVSLSQIKYSHSFKEYSKKRFGKVYKHFLIIYGLTFMAYHFFMPTNVTQQIVSQNHLNPFIPEIVSNLSLHTVFQFFGPKMDWYIFTTLILYLIFYLAYLLSNRFQNKNIALLLIFLVLLIAYYLFAYQYYGKSLAHYYRNLWAFGLGVYLSLYNKVKDLKLIGIVVSILFFNYFMEGSDYAKATVMSLFVLFLLGGTKFVYGINSSLFKWLGAISFPLYLSHRMWYNLLWSFDCLNFILFVVLSLSFATLYYYAPRLILGTKDDYGLFVYEKKRKSYK